MEVPSLLKTCHRGSHSSNRRVAGDRDHPKELLGPAEVTWISFIFPGKYRRGDDNLTWSELRIQTAAYAKAYNAAHPFTNVVTRNKDDQVVMSKHIVHSSNTCLN